MPSSTSPCPLLYMLPRKRPGTAKTEEKALSESEPSRKIPKKESGSSSSAAASDIPSPSDPTEIDEELYYRQLAVYGIETMRKLARSNVLISGLSGLGAEIAKNLVVAGVKSVTLHDDESVQLRDLSSNFFLSDDDVGKNRALACIRKLQELNNAVSVSTLTDLFPSKLSDFQAVVFTDISLEKAIEYDDYCHNHEPPIAFIKAEVRGLFGYIFCDFGPEFTVVDVNGAEPHMGIIVSISNGNPAEVCCFDTKELEFQDGDLVVFSEVEGMTELNDGQVRRIKKVREYAFTLEEDTTSFGRYERRGIVTQVKQPKVLKFKPLRDALKDPGEFLPCDLCKFDRPQLFHLAFQALDKFRNDFGHFPAAGSFEDAEKLIALAVEVDENIGGGGFAEIDTKLLHQFASGSGAVLNPMAAVFGGIVGEEVVKACTGKFHPLHQFFYFQSVESLPVEPLNPSDLEPQNCRYDDQIHVFGHKLQKLLEDAKVFIVGSDVLECELLKNLALMGVCCSPEGMLTITDDNFIEKSNLRQQFLFRDRNIGEAKSTVAAGAATSINPNLHIEAFQIPVRSGAEDVFNVAFWRHLDVVSAPSPPPNVEATDYILSRCLYFQKPLLMSRILGTTCSTAMVIPHLTQYYGMFGDPPAKKKIPFHNIIRYFPVKIDHCLILANKEFENLFVKAPNEVNSFVSNPSVHIPSELKEISFGVRESVELIADCILGERCQTFDDCVAWAAVKFEDYFDYRVKRLTTLFPEDATYLSGVPMWCPPKRFPEPFQFSSADPAHISFILAASILRAETFGIPIPDSCRDILPNIVYGVLTDRVKTAADLNPMLDHNLHYDLKKSVSLAVKYHICDTIRKLKMCLGNLPPGFKMKPVQFEKGDYKKYHMDFIAGLANLRARNYRIPEVDKQRAKVLSGRVIPLLSSSVAVAAGFVCLELYKVLAGMHSREDYCNSHANLVTPAFSVHKPLPPKVTEYRGMSWTVWDHWDFNEDLTLGELLQWLHEKHIRVYGFRCDGIIVYNTESPDREQLPDERVVDMARIVAKVRLVPGNHLQFQMSCKNDQGVHIDVPPICISLQ